MHASSLERSAHFCAGKASIHPHLAQWRKLRERGSLYGSTQAGKELLAKDEENRRLRKELNQSRRQLEKAEAIIEVQKKVCAPFGISSQTEAGQP